MQLSLSNKVQNPFFFWLKNALGDLDTSITAGVNLTLKTNHVLDSELHKNSLVPTRFLIEVKEYSKWIFRNNRSKIIIMNVLTGFGC